MNKLTPKNRHAVKKQGSYYVSEYTTDIEVVYDPNADAFYFYDDTGSSLFELTPSEMQRSFPAIVPHFRSYLVENPRHKKKRSRKKVAKKHVVKKKSSVSVRSLVSRALK